MEVKYLSEDREAVALTVLNNQHHTGGLTGKYFNFHMDDLRLKPDQAGVMRAAVTSTPSLSV